jgi:predicted amidophosphoribosyltransferase
MVLTTIKRWLGRAPEPVSCPDCGAQVQRLYCDVCGYDLVRGAKDSHQPPRPA